MGKATEGSTSPQDDTEEAASSKTHWRKPAFVVAGGLLIVAYGTAILFPLLGPRTVSDPPKRACAAVADLSDGAPGILGPSTLTQSEMISWWDSTDLGQPSRLTVDIDELIELYASEADAEGVRSDLAFAQAVHETGYFENTDTEINNFAGIGHYDHVDSGFEFSDAPTGVRAHVQLLKRFAAGNDVQLVDDDVAPEAGASATTWDELAGTWATDEAYWDSLSLLYTAMLHHADRDLYYLSRESVTCLSSSAPPLA